MEERPDRVVLQGFAAVDEIELGLGGHEGAWLVVLERVGVHGVLLARSDGVDLVDDGG